MNLSPFTKTVSRKFIYKPPQNRNLSCSPESFSEEENFISIKQSTESKYWDPIPVSNNDEIPAVPLINMTDGMDDSSIINASDSHDLGAHDVSPPNQDSSNDTEMHQQDYDSNLDLDEPVQSSDEEIPTINIFEDHEFPDLPEDLLQDRKPKVGDSISFYNTNLNTWVEAIITHDLTKKWDNYYNIQYTNGNKDGLYLNPDTRWTFLTTSSGQPVAMGSIRSNCLPPSLQPSPQSPSHLLRVYSSESDSEAKDIDLNSILSSDTSAAESIGTLDKSRTASMEWDLSYLHLQSSLSNQLHSPHRSIPEQVINNDRVKNLNLYLPLSSTPNPPRRWISNVRQSLPLEREVTTKTSFTTFLQRLNPFKKKTL